MRKRSLADVMRMLSLLLLAATVLQGIPAQAIWHTELSEHFAGSAIYWYETNGWDNWDIYPPYPPGPPYSWGITGYIHYSGWNDGQSLWCVGAPNTLEPEWDPYPPYTNAWVKWGPLDLSHAVAAKASFWYYCWSEPVVDYFRWGAWPEDGFQMYEADRFSGITTSWSYGIVDFDSLEEGTVSLLGDNSVWLEFQFSSNWNQDSLMGAFIDEVIIAWDDGTFDLEAEQIWLARLDSIQVDSVSVGDSIRFAFRWIALGSGTTPDFDITCALDEVPFYTERRNAEIGSNQQIWQTTYSSPWVAQADTHKVVWMLDASREIAEASEENNDTLLTFVVEPPNVPPWIHITHPTWGDSADANFWITWEDEDPDDNAFITLYWDDDSSGYAGTPIPGALAIPEDDEADSVQWDTSILPEGTYWVLAYIGDSDTSMWAYSDGPLIVNHAVGLKDWGSSADNPAEFTLQSIFPNPFNNHTTVRLGLPTSAHIELNVYDTAGRLCATPFRGTLNAGYHEISWSPVNLPSGIYLLELRAPARTLRSKVIFLK